METHHQTCQHARSRITQLILVLLLLPIRFYQFFISPWLGNNCRFYPSCSCYALEALQQHGPVKGLYFTLRRLSKCHPWHSGGVDMVPPPNKK